MKKMIYPLNYECRELINHFGTLSDDETIELVVKDNSKKYFDNFAQFSKSLKYNISENFEESLDIVDALILVKGTTIADYLEKIKLAKDKGKKIFAVPSVMDLLPEIEAEKDIIRLEDEDVVNIEQVEDDQEIFEIDVPVIAVMGVGLNCDKFSCELYLRKYYQELGYKVLQFGSKEISPLFGFSSLPKFVLDYKIPIKDRIVYFNHFIMEQIKRERPDIIIIGSPDGIIPLNLTIHNNYGESSLIISSAIAIDYVVVGVYFDEDLQDDFLEYLDNCVKYKYNSELISVCISNTTYEPTAESFGKKVKYYHLDTENICEPLVINKKDKVLCNIHDLETMKLMADETLKHLQENVDVVL